MQASLSMETRLRASWHWQRIWCQREAAALIRFTQPRPFRRLTQKSRNILHLLVFPFSSTYMIIVFPILFFVVLNQLPILVLVYVLQILNLRPCLPSRLLRLLLPNLHTDLLFPTGLVSQIQQHLRNRLCTPNFHFEAMFHTLKKDFFMIFVVWLRWCRFELGDDGDARHLGSRADLGTLGNWTATAVRMGQVWRMASLPRAKEGSM
jgi:hypothetical protein